MLDSGRPRESQRMNSKKIKQAIEVFVHGVTFTRCFTHPYIGDQLLSEPNRSLWVMRDSPRASGKYRIEEWIGYGFAPAEIDQLARAQARGRFTICTILANDQSDEPMRAGFKEMGYRLIATEPFMVHSLGQIPTVDAPAKIERVKTQALADRVNKAAVVRQILPEHLMGDELQKAPLRQYAALIDDEIVGRVGAVMLRRDAGEDTSEDAGGDAAWVTRMYVKPEFRRRGIARALLSQMLQDDRAAGAVQSVLMASHTGAKLYSAVGYKQIGMLYIYTPKRE